MAWSSAARVERDSLVELAAAASSLAVDWMVDLGVVDMTVVERMLAVVVFVEALGGLVEVGGTVQVTPLPEG